MEAGPSPAPRAVGQAGLVGDGRDQGKAWEGTVAPVTGGGGLCPLLIPALCVHSPLLWDAGENCKSWHKSGTPISLLGTGGSGSPSPTKGGTAWVQHSVPCLLRQAREPRAPPRPWPAGPGVRYSQRSLLLTLHFPDKNAIPVPCPPSWRPYSPGSGSGHCRARQGGPAWSDPLILKMVKLRHRV